MPAQRFCGSQGGRICAGRDRAGAACGCSARTDSDNRGIYWITE